jgi:S-DNA-T family DNA segregation ATPase FtsK/SpoIIIE
LADAYQDEIPAEGINFAEAEKDKNVLFEGGIDEDLGDDDELYEAAKAEVIQAGKASTSYIQRKLRVGYARAARLIDLLEQKGVIGPGDGAKPREILMGQTGEKTDNTANLEQAADKILAETTSGEGEEMTTKVSTETKKKKREVDENGFEEPENPKNF